MISFHNKISIRAFGQGMCWLVVEEKISSNTALNTTDLNAFKNNHFPKIYEKFQNREDK